MIDRIIWWIHKLRVNYWLFWEQNGDEVVRLNSYTMRRRAEQDMIRTTGRNYYGDEVV